MKPFLAEDIDTSAVTTSEILNETVWAEDIATVPVNYFRNTK